MLKVRASYNLFFVKPAHCSKYLLFSETHDIIGRRHPMTKSVPVGDWPSQLWISNMRLQLELVCQYACMVMRYEDFVKIRPVIKR